MPTRAPRNRTVSCTEADHERLARRVMRLCASTSCSDLAGRVVAGDRYYFNVEAVKLKRRVIAPYRTSGTPKDWSKEPSGKFRLTHPSNIWTDITVPFWSMPENTDHPAQKPEKPMAKLILASSRPGDWVFDPFLGSGATAVVAEKLSRRWCGVEIDAEYQCLALKRLAAARTDPSIQGYSDGVFWERNTLPAARGGANTTAQMDSPICSHEIAVLLPRSPSGSSHEG